MSGQGCSPVCEKVDAMNTWSEQDRRSAIQALAERIGQDACHVALIGRDLNAVDDMGRRLVQTLRQDTALEVQVLLDVESDVLMGRINQRLSSLSLQDARDASRSRFAPQVWVLQVHEAAQSRQAEMLARTIRDFPAVNLRLLLLMTPALADELLAGALGRAFVPWRLPEPLSLLDGDDTALPRPAPDLDEPPHATPDEPSSPPSPVSLLERARAGLRYPPEPRMVALIAVTLLLVSLLVRCV